MASQELSSFLGALRRMLFNLVFVTVFILGEWFIGWLIAGTIGEGDSDTFANPPLSWIKLLSVWAVGLVWGIHILAETITWIATHFPYGNR